MTARIVGCNLILLHLCQPLFDEASTATTFVNLQAIVHAPEMGLKAQTCGFEAAHWYCS
jgi:hypothetical protein